MTEAVGETLTQTKADNLLTPDYQMKLLYPHRPWEDEPDHAEWVDPSTGYKCRIQRSADLGFLCGYVGVNRFQPAYGVGHDTLNVILGSTVHGGLTYSKRDGELWWFGFDCGHGGDFCPETAKKLLELMQEKGEPNPFIAATYEYQSTETYRTWEYVETEIRALVRLLSKANVTWAER